MPSLPIDIYNHGSKLLGSLKGYYLKEAGRSSLLRSHPDFPDFPPRSNGSTLLARDMSCWSAWLDSIPMCLTLLACDTPTLYYSASGHFDTSLR